LARMDAALITVGQGSLYHTTLASSPDGTSWRWLGHCVEVSAAEPASVTVVSLGPSPDGSLVCAGLSNGQGALMRVGQVRFAIPHLPACDHGVPACGCMICVGMLVFPRRRPSCVLLSLFRCRARAVPTLGCPVSVAGGQQLPRDWRAMGQQLWVLDHDALRVGALVAVAGEWSWRLAMPPLFPPSFH
jgi:hypothetical protein